jgi:cytochrome P450
MHAVLSTIVQESLRVRPPVGVLARFGPKGATLAGYNVSEKVLLVSPYIQHMDEAVWGSDAAEFKPERWLDADGPAQHVSQYSYMPFSRGPRDCIGSKFALLEAKTIMSMIYRQFEFKYAGEKPEEVLMSVTAHPKYGVPVRVRRRQAEQQQLSAAPRAAATVSR